MLIRLIHRDKVLLKLNKKIETGDVKMLNCEWCDYYKTMDFKANGGTKCMCEVTGFVFHKAVEDYEMENHPCYNYELNVEFEEVKKPHINLSMLEAAQ
jgi:hypothetical protein